MGEDLYLEPNRKAQINLFLIIIFAALLYLSIDPIVNYLTPSPNASLEELQVGARRISFLGICVRVLNFIIALYWAADSGRKGYLTLKLGTYPPPGTTVVRRTKILTGKQAVHQGYISILFAVLCTSLTILSGFTVWLSIKIWLLTL